MSPECRKTSVTKGRDSVHWAKCDVIPPRGRQEVARGVLGRDGHWLVSVVKPSADIHV